jgi:dihydroorotase
MKKIYLLFLAAFTFSVIVQAQTPPKAPASKAPAKTTVAKAPAAKTPAVPITKIYSIVIKGGHVIDPKNNIDEIMDIAIAGGAGAPGAGGGGGRGAGGGNKIALVAKNIDPRLARQVIDAKGLYVTPGLIDIHSHNFWGTNLGFQYGDGPSSLPPDGFTFRSGVTTIVDAGSPGWKSFPKYRLQTIQRSQTRVLVWLNIVGGGMRGEGRYESDTTDMNADSTARVALENKDVIVGIKVAHYTRGDWIPVDRGEKAAVMANNIPLIIDFGGSQRVKPLSIEELFMRRFRPGDIFTHCFAQLDYREFLVDTITNKIKPFVWEARKRGINFDVGYGGISFSYTQAVPAVQQGFYPTSISTDMHTGSMNAAMKDMITCMSKFLAMGIPLKEVIAESTWNPAKEIRREELGNLSVGSDADIALIGMRTGKFGLFDYTGRKIEATKKLECEMTLRAGRIVYDLNGRAANMIINPAVSMVAKK